MSIQNIGKRIKSDIDRVMYRRFPLSENVKTLPAGKPSPVIDSYLQSGFYQLKGETENLYIKKNGSEKYVSENAPDESAAFSGVINGFNDWIGNTARDVTKYSGFLQEGFEKSVSDVGAGIFDFTKTLTPIIWGIVAIAAIWLISKFTD